MSIAFFLTSWCSSSDPGRRDPETRALTWFELTKLSQIRFTAHAFTFPFDLAADWHNQSCSFPAFESSSQTFVQYISKSWTLWERKEASHLLQFLACLF